MRSKLIPCSILLFGANITIGSSPQLFCSILLFLWYRMHPFTPSQWQELELQALIFHYFTMGVPIPSHLLHPFRRSFSLDPFSLHLSMGYGRKVEEDPEPWRCKRTDGKKWRCSREAAGESKYCERHKHRGKKCLTKTPKMPMFASPNYNPCSGMSASSSYSPPHLTLYSQPAASNLSSFLGDTTHRCRFLMDTSGERSLSEGFSCEQKERPVWFKAKEEDHCFVFGADLKLQKKPVNVEGDGREVQSPKLQFNFMDGSWMDPREDRDTQLSISSYRH